MLRFIKRLIRRHSQPINKATAYEWRQKLSFLYAFIAWNAFALLIYKTWKKFDKKRNIESEDPSSLSSLENRWKGYRIASNPTFIRVDGFSKPKVWKPEVKETIKNEDASS